MRRLGGTATHRQAGLGHTQQRVLAHPLTRAASGREARVPAVLLTLKPFLLSLRWWSEALEPTPLAPLSLGSLDHSHSPPRQLHLLVVTSTLGN